MSTPDDKKLDVVDPAVPETAPDQGSVIHAEMAGVVRIDLAGGKAEARVVPDRRRSEVFRKPVIRAPGELSSAEVMGLVENLGGRVEICVMVPRVADNTILKSPKVQKFLSGLKARFDRVSHLFEELKWDDVVLSLGEEPGLLRQLIEWDDAGYEMNIVDVESGRIHFLNTSNEHLPDVGLVVLRSNLGFFEEIPRNEE